MSLADDLAALSTAGNNFSTEFGVAVARKTAATAQADTALLLDNETNAQVGTAMDADLVTHEATNGASHVTFAELNIYSKSQFDATLAAKLRMDALDVSQVGDLSYLDLGIKSSFKGASSPQSFRYYAVNVEDDGTLVYLRNGSNGSEVGVYYAYASNSFQGPLTPPIRTNRKYQPSYFPAGSTAHNVFKSDGKVIAGILQDASGTVTDIFVSITNGTFDDTNHQGFIIPAASWSVLFDPTTPFEFVLAPDGSIYIVLPDNSSILSGQLDINIYRVSPGWTNGGSVTPSDMGGFNTTSIGGVNYNMPDRFRVVEYFESTNTADNPLYLVTSYTASYLGTIATDSTGTLNTYSSFDPATGLMRMRITVDSQFIDLNTGSTLRPWVCMSFVLNMSTLVATIDDVATATRPQLTLDSANGWSKSGGLVSFDKNQTVPMSTLGSFDNLFYHSRGFVFAINDQALVDSPSWVSRASLTNTYSKPYDWLRWNANVTNASSVQFTPEYGSAIGCQIRASLPLDASYALVQAQGRDALGQFYSGLVHYQYGAEGATYASLNNGSYTGFALTPYRKFVKDLGFDETKYWSLVSEIASSGTVTTHGAYFVENFNDSGFQSVDSAALTSTGLVQVDPSVWDSLRTQAIAAVGETAGNIKISRISIVVPQNTSVPPWMSFTYVTVGLVEHNAVLSLSIPGDVRTGTIASFSVIAVVVARSGNTASDISDIASHVQAGGGISIYETTDAWLIGGTEKHVSIRTDGAGAFSYRFAVPKSTGVAEASSAGITAMTIQINATCYAALPNKAFGYFQQDDIRADSYTKAVFVPVATDLASFRSWSVPAVSSYRVLTSQDMAQGWIVYFTKRNLALMCGKCVEIQTSQVDLTTVVADPSNKNFWGYVEFDGTNIEYKIYAVSQPESRYRMYAFNIVTGPNINSFTITTEKPVRIGPYRPSSSSRGNAIPVTTGTPDATNHLSWT